MICTPSFSAASPLSTFKNGDPLDIPQIVGRRPVFDVAVHRVLEQDRGENAVAIEARAGDDARPHLMHQRVHLLFVGPSALFDPILRRVPGVLPPL